MTSIRKFAYAALLAASALSFVPSLASAQDAMQGRFTLPHEVRWTDFRVPAGQYEFAMASNSLAPVLRLKKLDGAQQRFMLLVPTTESTTTSDSAHLELLSTPAGSYVKALYLPELGITLEFAVPSHIPEKPVASAATTTAASGQ